MALTEHYFTRFEEENFYHIYNRTVDQKPMFKNEGNYEFFLKKYGKYLSRVIDTYAFCLLGNHFHLLVQIRNLTAFKKLSNLNAGEPEQTIHDIVSHQFRNFFNLTQWHSTNNRKEPVHFSNTVQTGISG